MRVPIATLLGLAGTAGEILRSYFDSGNNRVQKKADDSPVTDADMASNQFLVGELCKRFPYPVISEESHSNWAQALHSQAFWLLDPLDGTQAFLSKSQEFSINLALMTKDGPKLGIIHAPMTHEFWYAEHGKGAFYTTEGSSPQTLPMVFPPDCQIIKSRLNDEKEVSHWMQQNGFSKMRGISSAIKFGQVAMGKASAYLRYAPSSEWDTAAGHVLVKESGGGMKMLSGKSDPTYLKQGFRNEAFIAFAKGVNCRGFRF